VVRQSSRSVFRVRLPAASFVDLSISAVIHKAFINVHEEGTEAAAATAMVMGRGAAIARNPIFRADHPLLFLIRDNRTGRILFLGRMVNPEGYGSQARTKEDQASAKRPTLKAATRRYQLREATKFYLPTMGTGFSLELGRKKGVSTGNAAFR
jgi:hypothetical protein